ncbi:serine/threonine-protein kinase pim-1-like [Plectropomus leopardus]|uniref:serine/threonine-protein kinase pim-1-like n=1 Tax=Plectropomus leopardus TaxID=160734 RepID=UPI001C4C9C1F|nr:serine/threonine-protein kinase pim-1-like [Plectropomus leopardus]
MGGDEKKANPEKATLRKHIRVSESENTSSERVGVKKLKRKVREDGEGPLKKKVKRRLDLLKYDRESASSSPDTGKENCNTSVEDVSKRRRKRKAAADGEGPTCNKTILMPEEVKDEARELKTEDLLVDAQTAYEAKYQQEHQLGEGGCGSVFAGYRKEDNLPVAVKHIPKDKVFCKHVDKNGKEISVEVAIMLKLAAGSSGSVGTSAPVSLLDWYDLGQELILVLERPVPSNDLTEYIELNGGSLQEEEARIILKQLVDAALDLEGQHIFHRDIKSENILIETGSDVPRVRIIDFGLSCFVKKRSSYHIFYGTSSYTPPEWHRRFTYRAGPTTVWQLGAVLYETLHRCTAFETTKFLEKQQTISNKLSEHCQDFLQMCLKEDPKQRLTLEELQLHPWLR